MLSLGQGLELGLGLGLRPLLGLLPRQKHLTSVRDCSHGHNSYNITTDIVKSKPCKTKTNKALVYSVGMRMLIEQSSNFVAVIFIESLPCGGLARLEISKCIGCI